MLTFAQINESTVASWTSSFGLNFLLREFIGQLPLMEELSLNVQDGAFLLPAIVKHADTLRKLEFSGAIPSPKTKKPMSLKDLEIIQQSLPKLLRLELNLDIPEENVGHIPL